MNFSELSKVIEQVGKDKGIKKEVVIEALEQAVLFAAKKKYGVVAEIEASYNEETGDVELFQFKTVVHKVGNPVLDISIVDARKLDPNAQIDDDIGIPLSNDLGRIAAQTAKQVIFQRIREAEHEIIFNEYIHRKGELVSGVARRVEGGSLIVNLGKTDALMPKKEIIPGETYKVGDRVQAFLLNVENTGRGPKIILSRTCTQYLGKLFEAEVPEIREGIIEIKSIAREPGVRAKIAVYTNDRDIDPVGACVGMKGMRVQNIVSELRGERIDIVPWNEMPELFVQKALSPAEIDSIKIDYDRHSMEVIVPDDQLSLAIGKKGVNVRLAAMLTGWRLDITSKSKVEKRQAEAIFNLMTIDGLGEAVARVMFQKGIMDIKQLAGLDPQRLVNIEGITMEAATKYIESAKKVLETGGDSVMMSIEGEQLGTASGSNADFSTDKKNDKGQTNQ